MYLLYNNQKKYITLNRSDFGPEYLIVNREEAYIFQTHLSKDLEYHNKCIQDKVDHIKRTFGHQYKDIDIEMVKFIPEDSVVIDL